MRHHVQPEALKRLKRYKEFMRVSVAFACLLTLGCAHETKERPPAEHTSAPSPSALPLPESAFSDPSQTPTADRSAPRRIGPITDDGQSRGDGARIDLDVKEADLHDVFRLIADVGKVNIVVPGDVSGTITVKLTRVPWDLALKLVAKLKGLALERDGNVIIVHAQ
jgi:hypothetical protein